MTGESDPRTLIDDLLETQQRLTAVERFSQKHERHALPSQERYYRDLIPLNRPQKDEQYAFAVDLDACTGCKACVSACHSMNGLDEEELWRTVGLLHGGSNEEAYHQTVTTACHHCVDPACANGCPVLAYEKDEETGIVRHLDDQCIGCQYCVLKCPYDVPKYSSKKGIVRKCDMCHGRLAAGEAPACVQACPNGAIKIEIVRKDVVLKRAANDARLTPGTVESSYTRPTTRFHTTRNIPNNARPADNEALRLDHPHWPLAIMLVLTQLAAGVHGVHTWMLNRGTQAPYLFSAITGAALLIIGMIVSFTHLGRPLKAWRAFLGLRKSWMSREIVAFSAYAGAASLLVLLPHNLLVSAGALGMAVVSVFCSAMIYIDTQRPYWAAGRTLPKFFGTAALLGTATAGALFGWTAPALAPGLVLAATLIRVALFSWEANVLLRTLRDPSAPTYRSALVLTRLMRPIVTSRVILFVISTVFSIMAIFNAGGSVAVWATIAFISTLAAQILERHAYFAAAASPRMPGGVPA